MPYDDSGQHWLKLWLVAWRHQAIIWTNVDSSSLQPNDIHLTTVSQEPVITKINLKSNFVKFYLHLPGATELIDWPSGDLSKFYFNTL